MACVRRLVAASPIVNKKKASTSEDCFACYARRSSNCGDKAAISAWSDAASPRHFERLYAHSDASLASFTAKPSLADGEGGPAGGPPPPPLRTSPGQAASSAHQAQTSSQAGIAGGRWSIWFGCSLG